MAQFHEEVVKESNKFFGEGLVLLVVDEVVVVREEGGDESGKQCGVFNVLLGVREARRSVQVRLFV